MSKPAIEGGKAVRSQFLIFGKPRIFKDEMKEVMDTLRSGWIGTGKKTHTFEKAFGKYIHNPQVIALNSATAGLHLALDIFNVNTGDEVITTPLTFAATANVIEHRNAKPIFVDVLADTWNIDPSKIKYAITKKTKALIPVHLHGRPCEMDQIHDLSHHYSFPVIEDAAHATESWFKGGKIGSLSDATVFSFYATKNLTTAEGGMLSLKDKELYHEARIKSLHGINEDAWSRYSASGFKPYETVYAGYKYNMTDLQASLGIHQLKRIESNMKIRRRYWDRYYKALSQFKEIQLPALIPEDVNHARHLFAIVIKTEKLTIDRNRFIEALQAEGIGVGIHFTALPFHAYYQQKYKISRDTIPVASYLSDRFISLPFYPHMTETDIDDTIQAVTKLIIYYRRRYRKSNYQKLRD